LDEARGPGTVGPDKRTVTRLRQELRINQRAEKCIADVALQTPQALCLRGRQPKPGHFDELTLDSLQHVVNTHFGTSRVIQF
jgi:hypothetical protein